MMRRSKHLPDSVVDLIVQDYGVHLSASISLDGGDEASAWRGQAERPVLIHLSPTWRTADELSWVHELLARLAPVFPEAVAPLRTLAGRTFVRYDGAFITLYPFIAGAHVDRDDAAQRQASAVLLASLQGALLRQSMPLRPSPGPDSPWTGLHSVDPAELVDPDLDKWHEAFDARRDLIRGLTHGDYYRRNLLWSRGRIQAVVDWHEARHDVLIAEVASAAWEFGKDPTGTRLHAVRARSFLEDYRRAGGPAEVDEDELIVPLIRWRLRNEARLSVVLAARALPDLHRPYREAVTAAFIGLRGQSL